MLGKREMMLFKIAFRNILRNGRRSLMTASAIAVGAVALILFGEYRSTAAVGLETDTVQGIGHLSVFRKGFSDFGSGRPGAYSISGYRAIMQMIGSDPELKPMLNVVTATVSLGGIAGNAATDRSMTFYGTGFVPSDRDKMRRWDEYRLYNTVHYSPYPLSDKDVDRGVVGRGLARILGLCRQLNVAGCPAQQQAAGGAVAAGPPRLDLLGGESGAPNIVALYVNRAQSQGAREMDDHYVGMHLALAQQLLYGSGERKVSAIVIQLKRTEDMARARARLEALFAAHHLDLEVRDFKELAPFVTRITSYLLTAFSFVTAVLGLIVLFTIANTMSMSVMERTNEIGTSRAMGVRRGRVRRQFLLEGAILGVLGATAGLVLAMVLTCVINNAGITYTMPISASAFPLYLMADHVDGVRAGVWFTLVLMAVIASFFPAGRAARMKVVDALRHV